MNFIDLFAGASGMAEGFTKAGFNPITHIEMNEEACFTIKTRSIYHYLKSNKNLDLYNWRPSMSGLFSYRKTSRKY